MSAEQVAKKGPRGCWTCKRRKIGCDKSLPSCCNCIRTKRDCEGYGIKLSWPDDEDGRRPNSIQCSSVPKQHFSSFRGPVHFLNTSDEDLAKETKRPLPQALTRWWSSDSTTTSIGQGPPLSLAFGYEIALNTQESSILSYYTDILSRMVTTIDDSKNGFRTTLLPMALSEANYATSALRQAISAISAYHLWGHDAAVKYKLSSIRHLCKSLQVEEDAAVPQFATSMMLCIGDVFDSVDGSWTKHLDAAKRICGRLPRQAMQDKDVLFFQTLLEYHDVLKGFSSGRYQTTHADSDMDTRPLTLPGPGEHDTIIIGALGCSRELMNLIAMITRLHGLTALPQHLQPMATLIQTRLENLIQNPLLVPDADSGTLDCTRIRDTAELYRLAALIYFHTTILPLPRSSSQLQSLISQSLALLETFEVCTSPWPLFITAIEVNNDLDRVRVLRVLEIMQRVRRIGNVDVLQRVVEVLWKQVDLRADISGDENETRLNWRQFFNLEDRLPSFI